MTPTTNSANNNAAGEWPRTYSVTSVDSSAVPNAAACMPPMTPVSAQPGGTASGGSVGEYASFVLTIGKGYRCLIQRFSDNYREDEQVMRSRQRDYFACMWRTEESNVLG